MRCLSALGAVTALLVSVPAAAGPREDAVIVRAIEAAVSRASRPAMGPNGATTARLYPLPGYGLFLLLPPRLLPPPVSAGPTRELRRATEVMEQAVTAVDASEVRSRMEVSLLALRRSLEARDRLLAAERPGAPPLREADLRQLEEDAALYRRQADRARAHAEEALALTLQTLTEQGAWPAPPPWVDLLPRPGVPAGGAIRDTPAKDPAAAARPSSPAVSPPLAGATPPWTPWLDAPRADRRSPERVVADVKAAVVDTLVAHAKLALGTESLAVAVDLQPSSRPTATRGLLLRVRHADLQALASGVIDEAELRRRIEIIER